MRSREEILKDLQDAAAKSDMARTCHTMRVLIELLLDFRDIALVSGPPPVHHPASPAPPKVK